MSTALENWIPFKLTIQEEHPYCEWMYTGDNPFTAPFFDETISQCRTAHPRKFRSVSSLDVLRGWSRDLEHIPPSALIFHVSRCGSTLATQLLAQDPGNIVLSEVPFFDSLLRTGNAGLLKEAVVFYAPVKNNRKRLFIKTDSWHIFFYKELRELYPQTPFILLYRRPDEVARSQQKRRGMHAIPGLIEPALFGFDTDVRQMNMDTYLGEVLDKYFLAFLKVLEKDPLAYPINYNEGPVTMLEKIARITDTHISTEAMEKIKDRALYHAKYPGQVFAEDAVKQPVPDYCCEAFDKYGALEIIRNSYNF
ncbi:sulfotransferase family protein [Chitinophaga jiangningensis]|nr:sulfotransferase family protein [Chitinophaga jiangningensis]